MLLLFMQEASANPALLEPPVVAKPRRSRVETLELPAQISSGGNVTQSFGGGADVIANASTSFGGGAHISARLVQSLLAGARLTASVSLSLAAGARVSGSPTGSFTAGARVARTTAIVLGAGAALRATVTAVFGAGASIPTFGNTIRVSFDAASAIARLFTTSNHFGAGAFTLTKPRQHDRKCTVYSVQRDVDVYMVKYTKVATREVVVFPVVRVVDVHAEYLP